MNSLSELTEWIHRMNSLRDTTGTTGKTFFQFFPKINQIFFSPKFDAKSQDYLKKHLISQNVAFFKLTRTRRRWLPKRGRPGEGKSQDSITILDFFPHLLAAKVPGPG